MEGVLIKLITFIGKDGMRYFSHLRGLTGTCSPVLRLNFKKKGIPTHPVHWREGMQIRNFLRTLDECKDWDQDQLDNEWEGLVSKAVDKWKE